MNPDDLRDTLVEIRLDVKAILKRLGDGDVRFENLNGRLKRVEWVVWPAVSIILSAVVAAGLALVLRK